MRRRNRILLNAATVFSLMLFLAAIALWIRGHFVVDLLTSMQDGGPAPTEIRGWSIVSTMGNIQFVRSRVTIPALDGVQAAAWDKWRAVIKKRARWRSIPLPDSMEASSGFLFNHEQEAVPTAWSTARIFLDEWRFGLPYWLLAAVTTILPIARGVKYMRWKRRPQLGRCATCGYDLRATPDRCPECGTAASPAAAALLRRKGED